jgi:urease accessory protein
MPPAVTARMTITALITIMTTRTTTMRPTIIRTITAIVITTMIMATTTTSMVRTSITIIPMLMTTNRSAPAAASCGMTEREAAALYRLMTWLSPAFPVGGFSYSSGIEWAVEVGDVTDATSLRDWLGAMLADGSGFCDGVFLAQAHRVVEAGDDAALRDIAELAAAFVSSRERQLETSSQGRAFMEIARAAWSCAALQRTVVQYDGILVYPVAVGLVGAAHDIPLPQTLHAYLHALASNWISAASRLVPLGQTDSQRVLAALEPVVAATANRALSATLDDLGSATFRADLAGLRHETQYTRLFRS